MPTRDEIKPQVIAKLNAVTDPKPLLTLTTDESLNLFDELGMTATLKKAMGVPYTKISSKYDGGLGVSMSDAGKCETLKDSIELVFKRANGKK